MQFKLKDDKFSSAKFGGSMTLQQAKDYVRGLKLYLARMGCTYHEKVGIENEINDFERAIELTKRITPY